MQCPWIGWETFYKNVYLRVLASPLPNELWKRPSSYLRRHDLIVTAQESDVAAMRNDRTESSKKQSSSSCRVLEEPREIGG